MLVVQGVEDLAPLLVRANQTQMTQSTQLMRHSRLTHVQSVRQMTDAQLPAGEGRNDADPCGSPRVLNVSASLSANGGLNRFTCDCPGPARSTGSDISVSVASSGASIVYEYMLM